MAIIRRIVNRCSELVKTGRTFIRHTAASLHSKGYKKEGKLSSSERKAFEKQQEINGIVGGEQQQQKKRDPLLTLINKAKKHSLSKARPDQGTQPRKQDQESRTFKSLRSTGSRIAATAANIVPIVAFEDTKINNNNNKRDKKAKFGTRSGARAPSIISMANSTNTTNTNSLIMNEDEIIRRKLLIDGDGVGDDRRLHILVKNFFKWLSADQSAEERRANYERILLLLDNCEHAMQKSHQMLLMNQREMKNYEKLYKKIEAGIEDAQKKIQDTKRDLLEAKRERKNKEEYDALARTIESHPKRQDTLARLNLLEEEMKKLNAVKEDVNEKLNRRRRQLAVLLGAANDLQVIMQEGLDTNGNSLPGMKDSLGAIGANLGSNINALSRINDILDREDGEMDDNEEMDVAEEGQVV